MLWFAYVAGMTDDIIDLACLCDIEDDGELVNGIEDIEQLSAMSLSIIIQNEETSKERQQRL